MEEYAAVPADLKRRVLIEAGHRCAIPTCRAPTKEVAHIEPRAVAKEHENLVALCPDCQARLNKGEIDRKLLPAYKRILQRLTGKYSPFEVATLNELRQGRGVRIGSNMLPMIKNLLDEKLIDLTSPRVAADGTPGTRIAALTAEGNRFIEEWIKGNEELAR